METRTSSSPSSGPSYEVFLNFRGIDTRHTFTDFLYHHMVSAGITVFRDNESLHVGQEIGGELLQAIENSQIYIPIFSKKYASSCWCLRELAHMVECTLKSNGKKEILPIFLGVKPADVKLKTNWYEQNLSKRQRISSSSEEESWKKALIDVSMRKGWTWKKDQSQVDLIQSIIRTVMAKLNVRSKKIVTEDLVGVDDQVKEIIGKLDVGSDDVRFLGIYGMAGIGKTTLAKVVFNQLSLHFQGCNFLSNVGESSRRHGLRGLQKQLLSKFSPISGKIDDEDDGINKIKRELCHKKVLIVLDDVDEKEQLKNLAGKGSWFGFGSRIIITTRDQSVLRIEGEVTDDGSTEKSINVLSHEVREMEFDHALKLFSRHAFKRDSPPDYYASLSEEAVSTLGKLPLALEVIGASLFGESKISWVATLRKLKEVPPTKVEEKLMITYDRLDYSQKQVFLDVASFFVNEDKTYACYMWDACGYYPHNALEVLVFRSFIKINDDNTFWMHDLLRDLGRKIVREENFDDPCGRSRVWNHEEALKILKQKERNQRIKALSLVFEPEDIILKLGDFPTLRFFRAFGVSLVGDFNNPLSSLTWLSCRRCPLDFGPNSFCPPNLVVLDLSNSSISEKGIRWIKAARKLKVLNLSCCPNLVRTPDLSTLVSLEILDLEGCERLVAIDPSIGELKHLISLNLRDCPSLRELPEGIGCLQALTKVAMPPMPRQFEFQQMSSNLKSSLTLNLSGTHISKLPHSTGGIVKITVLTLCGCRNIEDLPDWVWNLQSLIELDLSETSISHLSDSINNLKRLTVLRMRGMMEITKLPSTIWLLEKLEVLDAGGCKNLTGKIAEDVERLSYLRILDLSGTQILKLPTTVSRLSNLQELNLYDCCEFEHLPELPPSLTRLTWGAKRCSLYGLPHRRFFPRLPSSLRELRLEDVMTTTLPDISGELQIEDVMTTTLPDFSSWLQNLMAMLSRLEDVMTTTLPDFSGELQIEDVMTTKLPDFSDSRLCEPELDIFTARLVAFQLEMKRLTSLSLIRCEFCQEVFDLSLMKELQEVWLEDCWSLVEIRGLEELGSLSSLTVERCSSIERMSDLSKLRKLRELGVEKCPKLRSVEGLNHLESLEQLWIRDCESLESLADTSNLDLFCLKIIGCGQLPNRANHCKRGKDCYCRVSKGTRTTLRSRANHWSIV